MNFIEMTEKLNDFEDLKISTNLNARNIFSMNIGVFARRPHWTPNTKFIFSSKIIPNWNMLEIKVTYFHVNLMKMLIKKSLKK